ncbi:hypothetical protein [Pseudanabaena sp. FACHB-2040]|uniref:hypothetical protein n=1 Tax=Pseudanabaena sp. FACHB-2040 TaxID=2692859 RepID=UPI001681C4BD|nr:hypothetical protein [Pseudanabaena sp. FACHB-2040]MBD2256730.1 hypothetical protein [Pseudanabaena sp. FACHB-2040]
MSLTQNEREKIRRYFGYPAATGWTNQIQLFCDRFSVTQPEAEETVRSLLRQIEQINLQLQQTLGDEQAGQKPLNSSTGQEVSVLRREQRQHVQTLSGFLGLPIHRAVFGGEGWQSSRRVAR